MINTFLEIQNLALSFKNLGYLETDYARLYAKATHIAPQAWLHAIFKPLSKSDIELLKEKTTILPEFYEDFLKLANGFSIFGSTLSFYGLRKNYERSIDNVWQPYDLSDLNSWDKPNDSEGKEFFFAAYSWDGSYVYYDFRDSKIKRCSRDSIKPLNKWDSLEEFVITEILRITKLFNSEGLKINPGGATTPASVRL